MTTEQALNWMCNYCSRVERQSGPRAGALPSVPPPGWLRLDMVRHREIPASPDRKKSEELQTIRHDACPECAPRIERVVLSLKPNGT